jgi:hypothetical protein
VVCLCLCRRAKKYSEAEKVKRVADELELRERSKIDEERLQIFQQKEAKFRAQQQAELAALLKRIDCRRREHLKQRELDSKRCVALPEPCAVVSYAAVVLLPCRSLPLSLCHRVTCPSRGVPSHLVTYCRGRRRRLLQRNRNVQAVLDSKQLVEAEKRKTDVKLALSLARRPGDAPTPDTASKSGKVKGKKKSPSATASSTE